MCPPPAQHSWQRPPVPARASRGGGPRRVARTAYPGPGQLRVLSPVDARGRGGGEHRQPSHAGPAATHPSRHPTKPTEFPGRGGSAAFGRPRPGRGDGRPTPGTTYPQWQERPRVRSGAPGHQPGAIPKDATQPDPGGRRRALADSPCRAFGHAPQVGGAPFWSRVLQLMPARPRPSPPSRGEGLGGGFLRV